MGAEVRRIRGPAGRVPPHSMEAEESLLGAVMLSREALAEAADMLSADDFYKPAHSHIFAAAMTLWGRGDPVDPMTLVDVLKSQGLLEAAGGVATMSSLQANTPSSTNAGRYARTVADKATLRRLIGVAGEIAEIGYEAPEDARLAVDQAEALLFALDPGRRPRQAAQLGSTLEAWLDRMEARFEHGDLAGTPTGFADIDDMLLGFQPGQLITGAARPGMGKSSWAGAVATNVASAGRPVLFVSVEMSLEELQDRFVSSAAKVLLQDVRRAKLSEKDWARISQGLGRLAEIPLWVLDEPAATLMTVRSAARRLASREGTLGLIVVDYLQLLTSTTRTENRQVEVAELSRGLKKMAGELKTPVLALAQLNRGLEQRSDKRPTLSDLRESGAIENDSDVVLFLYREEYYKPNTNEKGVAEVIVAKQRNGPTGTARLLYDGSRGFWGPLGRQDP